MKGGKKTKSKFVKLHFDEYYGSCNGFGYGSGYGSGGYEWSCSDYGHGKGTGDGAGDVFEDGIGYYPTGYSAYGSRRSSLSGDGYDASHLTGEGEGYEDCTGGNYDDED